MKIDEVYGKDVGSQYVEADKIGRDAYNDIEDLLCLASFGKHPDVQWCAQVHLLRIVKRLGVQTIFCLLLQFSRLR